MSRISADYTPMFKEVNFLRAYVNHFSFVTGLYGKLSGKEGNREDSSVGVNVILNADIYEGYEVVNPSMYSPLKESCGKNVLEGKLFQCCDLLSWIAGTFDSKDLKNHNRPDGFFQPTEFLIETWEAKEGSFGDRIDTKYPKLYEWQIKKKTKWEGVKWLNAAHTGDGGDRMCAGIATFTCDNKTVENIEDGEIIDVPKQTSHPYFELRSILLRRMDGPKHPESYLG